METRLGLRLYHSGDLGPWCIDSAQRAHGESEVCRSCDGMS